MKNNIEVSSLIIGLLINEPDITIFARQSVQSSRKSFNFSIGSLIVQDRTL